MPVEDRAADTWAPLVAIADLAGGDWPKRARKAAKNFNGIAEEASATEKLATRLLADLRDIFGDWESLHGATILTALHKLEEAPWSDYYGRLLNANDLAKLLKPYGITSKDVKISGTNLKGYSRDVLWDVWQRYLPPLDEHADTNTQAATGATSATSQVDPVAAELEVAAQSATSYAVENQVAPISATVPVGATGPTRQVAQVAGVAANWPTAEGGSCGRCGAWTHKYGVGGNPLCADCRSSKAA